MRSRYVFRLLFKIDEGYRPTDAEMHDLKSVKRLRMRGFYALPKSITMLTSLVNLDLANSYFYDISALSGLTTLTNLDLSGNENLRDISALSDLKALTKLNLSHNRNLTDLSPLSNLIELTELDLSFHSMLTDISALSGLTNLKILNLSGKWGESRHSELRYPAEELPSYYGISELSDISPLSKLNRLTDLDLSWNENLRNISALSNLKTLRKLDLSGTRNLTDFSPLSNLVGLEKLYLSYDYNLTDINTLSFLTGLTNLDLGSTRIADINPLSGLKALTNLTLQNTYVSDISPLSDLKALTNINLSWNKYLTDITPISGINSLISIDLRHLNLTNIPESILNLNIDFITKGSPTGPGIYIYGLTLTNQDITLFSQSRELILAYYNTLRKEESIPINECKVVFLGDGGAGKSLIINRLLNKGKLSPDFNGESTPGIDINSKEYTIGNDKLELHFWDFGGEAIMHSMHRMFLTNRTLYVIVTNARENNANDQAWYWIRNVKSFAPGAPVFLIVNHKDENPFVDINVNGLQNEYPGLQDFKIISALVDSPEEFNWNVRDKILQIVTSMESVHTPFVKSWLKLKNDLQEMPDNRISSKAFCAKCKDNGIVTDEQVMDLIVNWYQDLGVCFYSRKYRFSRKYMVLKPKWILNALYILIFNGRKYSKNGIIHEDDIYKLINEDVSKEEIKKVYTDIRYDDDDVQYIINVLVNFDLVRRLDNDSIFIPMLCDENEPKNIKEFDSDDVLHTIFKYIYLPENVLYLLMLRQQYELNLRKVWKSGAILEQTIFGWKALVRVRRNKLDIYVKSQNQEEYPVGLYMEILRAAINKINHELGLTADEYISFRESGLEDHFSLEIIEGSKKSGLLKIYSGVFKRVIEIDDILGKSVKKQDKQINGVIEQMLSSLSDMSELIAFKENACEVELTADFQQRIASSLNLRYGIQIERECTMGRSRISIGETDLYFYKYEDGIKQELYILENKALKDFKKPQYGQLVGYLNPYFSAGITLSINKDKGWEEAFDYIYEKLEELQKEGGDFAPIVIDRKTGTNGTKYIKSEFIIPNDGRTMPVYHLVMQLYDKEWCEMAKKAREKKT